MARSMQDLLRERQLAGFVGRRAELALFQANLRTSPEDIEHRFLFHVHGNSGVGKSSLLRRFIQSAREHHALTATLDESVRSVPEAMEEICGQFAGQGFQLKALERMLATYRQRRYEAEAATASSAPDPATAHTPSAGSMVAAQAGLIGISLVPGIGAIAGAIDPGRVASGADGVRAALSRHFGKQEDVQLVLDPVGSLTPVFLAELERIAGQAPWIAFFFDTYERSAPFLDPWLRDLTVTGRYGVVPGQTIVTTSGQRPVDPHVWANWTHHITEIPLATFTETEARQLLAGKRVVDEDVVRDVLRLSGRLPVLVSLLAENSGRAGELDDPSATAVERFLRWETDPVRRAAALDGALPRRLNEDIFRAAAESPEAGELFGWVRELPFVHHRGGRVQYHGVVREPMLRLRRISSPGRWTTGHTRLADAFAEWCAAAGEGLDAAERWALDSWRELRLGEIYHRLCARPRTGIPAALRDGVDACDAGAARARQWAETLIDAGTDADSQALRSLGQESLRALEDERRGGVELLGLVLSRSELTREDRAVALTVRALAHRYLNEYREALRDFRQAIEIDAGCGRAHFGMAETHRLMRSYDEALICFDRALALAPEDSAVLAGRGWTRHSAGRSREALADLDRALELKPDHMWALVRRAQIKNALGDSDGALADVAWARDISPAHPWIIGENGEILRSLGRYEEAVACYDRAIVLDQSYTWAMGSRAMAKKALGRVDEALTDLAMALEMRPDYVWALLRRAEIHRDRGDREAEFADLDRVVEFAERRAWALVQRGGAHHLAGRYEAALADFDAAIAHDPDHAPAHVGRGRALERMGRYEAALASVETGLRLNPDSAYALTVRAAVRGATGDTEGEFADLEAAVAAEPDEAEHLVLRGEAHRRAGRYPEAITDYTRAAALASGDGLAFAGRGSALRALGRPREALADLTRAEELHPGTAWIAAERGAAHQDLGRPHEALADLNLAIARDPAHGWAHLLRGRVHLALAAPDRALADARRLMALPAPSGHALAAELLTSPALADSPEAAELLTALRAATPGEGEGGAGRGA
ncbi:tetratricopeptide repeat protein [Streptomyces sp. CAU 1734]|uniref:tetratricopeptide repeat protein n=1 Tax=Streptomyces sp. CAU 1734 TaxID=3140360 RepID=UPI0032604B5B